MEINTGEEIYDECNDYFNGYNIDKKPFQKKWVAVDEEITFLKKLHDYTVKNTLYAGLVKNEKANAWLVLTIKERIKQLEDTEK